MTKRIKFSTNTPSEKRVGYSRAIKVGEHTLLFSGTTSVDEKGHVVGKTVYEQTNFIFNRILEVTTKADFTREQLVLVSAYLVDIDSLSEFDKAFSENFFDINPCCTLVGISSLVDPRLTIEIEAIFEK